MNTVSPSNSYSTLLILKELNKKIFQTTGMYDSEFKLPLFQVDSCTNIVLPPSNKSLSAMRHLIASHDNLDEVFNAISRELHIDSYVWGREEQHLGGQELMFVYCASELTSNLLLMYAFADIEESYYGTSFIVGVDSLAKVVNRLIIKETMTVKKNLVLLSPMVQSMTFALNNSNDRNEIINSKLIEHLRELIALLHECDSVSLKQRHLPFLKFLLNSDLITVDKRFVSFLTKLIHSVESHWLDKSTNYQRKPLLVKRRQQLALQ